MLYNLGIDKDSIERYSRQIIVKQIGINGQKRLKQSKVLIFGLGGLGSPTLMYIAAAGIGTIGIADFDTVELHNLQRQVIHCEKDVGRCKTQSAYEFAKNLNSSNVVNIHEIDSSLCSAEFIKEYDIVLDCADNINARYTISDLCRIYEKPLVLASVLRFEGQIYTLTTEGPCYRCLFPEMRENVQTCDSAGVLGSVCGTIGSIQATEAIKYLLGKKKSELIVFDAWSNRMQSFDISLKKKENCHVCRYKEAPKRRLMGSLVSDIEPVPLKYRLEWDDYFKNKKEYTLVDIRPSSVFAISNVKDSVNFPCEDIKVDPNFNFKTKNKILFVCRRGITAKKMVCFMLKHKRDAYYISGGLEKFKKNYEPSFPI